MASQTYISSRVYASDNGGKCLALANGEFVRKMAIGNEWNTLRLGVLASWQGSANMTAFKFALGVCSGMDLPYGSASCLQWIGMFPNNNDPTTGQTQTYTAGPPSYWRQTTTRGGYGKKVAGVLTYGNLVNNSGMYQLGSTNNPNRTLFIVHIRKGSPNYSLWLRAYDSTTVLDWSYFDFIEALEGGNITLPGITGPDQTDLAFTETYPLDTFNLYINNAEANVMEIYAIGYARADD
jgi:hypothetical protein